MSYEARRARRYRYDMIASKLGEANHHYAKHIIAHHLPAGQS